jgi:hypothetical protein
MLHSIHWDRSEVDRDRILTLENRLASKVEIIDQMSTV